MNVLQQSNIHTNGYHTHALILASPDNFVYGYKYPDK